MISVCIATYNGEKYITEQLTSILQQIGPNDEVIISDDSSTDKTIDKVKEIKDTRIKIFTNTNGKGVIKNFENAIKHSKGEYIFLADQDDVWNKNKILKSLPLLEKYDLVISDNSVVDEKLNFIKKSFFNHKFTSSIIKNIYKNNYIGCCMAFKRKLISYIIPFPSFFMHDIWIGIIAKYYGSVYFIDEALILYRRHNNNVSTSSEKSKNSIIKKITYRLCIIFCFIKRIIKLSRI